jgi:peptidoglycan/LPS O-acetylase OafA/YrhL
MQPDPIVPFYRHALVCLFLMAVFVYVAIGQPRLLVNAIVCRLGVRSYSIYILHFFGLRVAHYFVRNDPSSTWSSPSVFLITLTLSWAAAEVTGRLIEEPGIRIGRMLSRAVRAKVTYANAL